MHNAQPILKLIFLTTITLAVLAAIVYGLLTLTGESQEAASDARYEVYERFANRYYAQLQFYNGVCSDMKPAAPAVCEDDDEAFRVYERLEDGSYNCTDKNGYQGQLPTIPRGSLSCR